MSRLESFKNKIDGGKKGDPVTNLVGVRGGQEESAAASENKNGFDLDAIAGAFSQEENKKPAKKLKGIYLDEDVLEIYEQEAKKRERGWGSQLTSDLLRAVFEKEGLLPKRNQ